MYYRNILIALILILLNGLNVYGQDLPAWQWAKRGGGPGYFSPNPILPFFFERIVDLAIDTDNNYYFLAEISGHRSSNLIDYDGQALSTYNTSDNNRDIYVFSTDSSGNFRWDKMIGGTYNDGAASINTDGQNNVYVSGTIIPNDESSMHFDQDTIIPPAGDPYEITDKAKGAFLIKYDQEGSFQWLQQPEGPHPVFYAPPQPAFMFGTIERTVVELDGRSHNLVFFPQGTHLDGQLELDDLPWREVRAAMVIYDSSGQLENFFELDMTSLSWNSYKYQLAYDAALDRYYIADTNYLTGDTISINGHGASNFDKSFYLAAVDGQGEVLWYHENNKRDRRALGDLKLDSEGNIYLTGKFRELDGNFAGYTFEALDSYEANGPFLLKLDSNGNLLWGTNGIQHSYFAGESIAIDGDRVYLGLPTLRNEWDNIFITGPQGQGWVPDPMIIRFDAQTGRAQGIIRMPESPAGHNGFTSIGIDSNGDIIGGGYFASHLFYDEPFAIFKSGGPSDFFIAKYAPREQACEPPASIHVQKLDGQSAKLYWMPFQGEDQWEIAFSNQPENPPIDILPNINPYNDGVGTRISVSGTPQTVLEQIEPEKHYQVFIRSICDGIPGSWSAPIYFKLDALSTDGCLSPTDIHIIESDTDSATVSWTPVGNEQQWLLTYGLPGFDPEQQGTALILNEPLAVLHDLEPHTDYVVYVRALCADETDSEWAGPANFSTDELTTQRNGTTALKIYPNPTDGILNLIADNEINDFRLYDLQGRILKKGKPEQDRIDLSSLNPGLYMLSITDIHGNRQWARVVKK